MSQITITEALSEVNLVKKKIQAKMAEVSPYVTRFSTTTDPFAEKGGSSIKIGQDFQSIRDLSARLQGIRFGISKANLSTQITIEGETKTIHDWLTWKREVYPDQKALLTQTIQQVRAELKKQQSHSPPAYRDEKGEPKFASLVINVDLDAVTKDLERLEQIYEKLDGQLSLKNATIMIEI